MRERLAKLNTRWASQGRPTIEIGIGFNTGRVIVGNMGSEKRFDYTVIGDDVNLASRLESLTKFYGVGILISEAALRQLNGRYLTRAIDKVAVKGKKEAVKIFELIGELVSATKAQKQKVKEFEAALGAYYGREWKVAEKLFKQFKDDKTAQHFVERCDKYLAEAPGDDWDGTYVAKEK
jgi:adenylate cyclase